MKEKMTMQSKSKKLLSTLLVLAMVFGLFAAMPMTASAITTSSELAALINAYDHGGTGELEATATDDTVTVTGTVTGATNMLSLNIYYGDEVIWKANYSGTRNGDLLYLQFPGTFEVAEGGSLINNGSGDTVWLRASNAEFKVSDGTVSNTGSGNAIYTTGTNNKITVSGGTVKATGSDSCAI
jgi:hypothetical protein